jgi:hypothetical protein
VLANFSPNGNAPMMVHGVGKHELRSTFKSPLMFSDKNYKIAGVTRDGSRAPLPNCIVNLFYTGQVGAGQDVLAATTRSDASGNYSFLIGPSLQCYVVAYLPGSPDVSGTTVDTLVAQ